MASIDTVQAITANLKEILEKGAGLKFANKVYEGDTAIPSGFLPLGQIFYQGEDFEYIHGQRPGYAEARFLIRVIHQESNPEKLMRELQELLHKVRASVSAVDALNINDLLTSKEVSRVISESDEINNRAESSILSYQVLIRYRES